jgi:DNA polymerase I
MQDTPTLLLVDGSSYLYRAFHAMPDLRVDRNDPASQATGAIRGMVNMLQSLRREYPTHHAVCVFDAKGPTFRDDIYPAIQSHALAHARRFAQPNRAHPPLGQAHGLATLGCARC